MTTKTTTANGEISKKRDWKAGDAVTVFLTEQDAEGLNNGHWMFNITPFNIAMWEPSCEVVHD